MFEEYAHGAKCLNDYKPFDVPIGRLMVTNKSLRECVFTFKLFCTHFAHNPFPSLLQLIRMQIFIGPRPPVRNINSRVVSSVEDQ